MRTVFVGTVHGSLVALNALVESGHPPYLVVTLPKDASARHSDFADLTELARQSGITVFHSRNINDAATLDAVRQVQPDLCLVVGWSQICKAEFLDLPKLGSIGFHPAPLPKFRGRAVIPWTILLDEKESGSSLFWLDKGTDSGDLVMQLNFQVDADETARSLYDKHTTNLAMMLPRVVAQITDGTVRRIPQDHAKASYCAKRTPDDGLIDWHESAKAIERLVRAVGEPYPGAFCFMGETKVVIDAARAAPNNGRFIGLPGQVQLSKSEGFTVLCGDGNLLEVLKWRSDPKGHPKIHSKLTGSGS